jgi:hypothetical protein
MLSGQTSLHTRWARWGAAGDFSAITDVQQSACVCRPGSCSALPCRICVVCWPPKAPTPPADFLWVFMSPPTPGLCVGGPVQPSHRRQPPGGRCLRICKEENRDVPQGCAHGFIMGGLLPRCSTRLRPAAAAATADSDMGGVLGLRLRRRVALRDTFVLTESAGAATAASCCDQQPPCHARQASLL